jgi:hypothetical protein
MEIPAEPADNLGNPRRRLVLPKRINAWSPTSVRQRSVKIGGRLVKYARHTRCCHGQEKRMMREIEIHIGNPG